MITRGVLAAFLSATGLGDSVTACVESYQTADRSEREHRFGAICRSVMDAAIPEGLRVGVEHAALA
ncbi:MAG TPA: hypothetical protein VFH83_01475, partial [Spirochaetia bacterium]|nr:hypothetical protein [Spirochaetia bacterium]